ncbi:hypothetical protein EMIHUDRAFT_244653 [Emiliania huxleyi CCMP1516]|uniref:Uncharacterized protein n=2 Tax=Emiliania huxleyi TaxID=2903 RepID=A0A0D3J0B0_EMIH1|nr:hypothetical protein EMIHUDRAFT_244653 [Emiliania huxleyi CCMP1516]EOD16945.1 hypothetical protein EMIHUDRAFT_244653 [Emiliania huxleyi CCMP1516]|eukprot:XP_005769374.1 hypothetical protein EMIHUDRAFT_244653 [Emiliania huxleyi CCMP1516]
MVLLFAANTADTALELTEEEQAVQNSLLQRERSRREDAEMSKAAAAPSDSSGPASPVKAAGQTSAAFGDASFGATPAGTAAMVLKGRPEEHDAPLGQIQTVQVKEEVIKEVVREVPKMVSVPVEVIREVPIEVIKEVEKIVYRDVIKEVFVDVIKEVPKVVEVVKVVEVPIVKEVVLEQVRVVEKPVTQVVEKEVIKEVEVVKEVVIEKEVERIVEKVVEVIVEKPVEIVKEVFRGVPYEVIKEVEVVREVEKLVEVPYETIREVVVEVIREKEVPVVQEVVTEVVKEVPVEVPKEVFVDRIVEVIVEKPIEIVKEVIKEVPIEVIREVVVEKQVPVDKVIIQEVIKEVPVDQVIKEVPRDVVREVPVEVVKIQEVPVEVVKWTDREVVKEVEVPRYLTPDIVHVDHSRTVSIPSSSQSFSNTTPQPGFRSYTVPRETYQTTPRTERVRAPEPQRVQTELLSTRSYSGDAIDELIKAALSGGEQRVPPSETGAARVAGGHKVYDSSGSAVKHDLFRGRFAAWKGSDGRGVTSEAGSSGELRVSLPEPRVSHTCGEPMPRAVSPLRGSDASLGMRESMSVAGNESAESSGSADARVYADGS